MKDVTVIIPTYNNPHQLIAAIVSLVRNTDFNGHVLVINNGELGLHEDVQKAVPYDIDWIDANENLGWCGGINLGLSKINTPFVCLCNDDVVFTINRTFWRDALRWFNVEGQLGLKVGGVGPISNYASGYQNMLSTNLPDHFLAPLLIGFCAIYRTELLGEGLDGSLPGGDDYDLSIRVRAQDYSLVVDRRLFVFHYGSQTGRRLHPDYWDSQQHQTEVLNAIAHKHSLRAYWELMHSKVVEVWGGWSMQDVTLAEAYHDVSTQRSDINDHIRFLHALASTCQSITEFGTDDGTTAIAFLNSYPRSLTCVDIVRKPAVDNLEKWASQYDVAFKFIQASTLEVEIEPTDMLFIDDLHTGAQVRAELKKHADKVNKYLVFHDTEITGYIGEGNSEGILPPILMFTKYHPEWRIMHHVSYNNGLTVLVRVSK